MRWDDLLRAAPDIFKSTRDPSWPEDPKTSQQLYLTPLKSSKFRTTTATGGGNTGFYGTWINLITLASLETSDLYLGDTSDVVDSRSMLVLVVSNSITSTKSVKKIGEKYHKELVEDIILIFVLAPLLIPGVGELANEAGLAAIAITSRAIGAAGDVGLSIYGIARAKDSGPTGIPLAILDRLDVLDMVKAPGLFAKAAKARRAMTPEHIATLGGEVKSGMARIDKLKQLCR
ncbi:unnamed protein product [Penicillium crustosum]